MFNISVGSTDSEEVFESTFQDAGLRRSKRKKKPFSYRGIDDYVTDFNIGPTTQSTRTLTEDSNLEEVIRKGETVKRRRRRRSISEPSCGSGDVVLPANFVVNLDRDLLPHRPLVSDAVHLQRCQYLGKPLEEVWRRNEIEEEP